MRCRLLALVLPETAMGCVLTNILRPSSGYLETATTALYQYICFRTCDAYSLAHKTGAPSRMTLTMYTTLWFAFRWASMRAEGLAVPAHECTEIRNGVDGGSEQM
jgi:hypothetical protein